MKYLKFNYEKFIKQNKLIFKILYQIKYYLDKKNMTLVYTNRQIIKYNYRS